MADPGTAVGVVSLGLQVTQSLLAYYSNYKTYADDIAHAVQRMKRLHETLSALEIPLQKLERSGDTVSERVRISICNCDHELIKLNEVVRKCGEVPASQSVAAKLKIVEKRLAYPLRKGTLRDVSAWVDRAQDDLDTALHALQLKVSVESQEEMARYAVSFDNQLAAIQFGQLNAMQSLHSLHQASNISVQQNQLVAQNLEGVSLQQQQIAQQISTLMQITTAIADQKLLTPSTISQGMAAAEDLTILGVTKHQNADIEPRQSFPSRSSVRSSSRCTCSNSLSNASFAGPNSSLSFFWRSKSTHKSWCPLSRTLQTSHSVGIKIRYSASMFAYIAECTLNCTWGTGGYSMSQGLTLRRVVSDENPAFKLFDPRYIEDDGFRFPDSEVFKRSLDQYLRDGTVNAIDVNKFGQTLLHVVCVYLTHYVQFKGGQPSVDKVLDLLDFLISAGVPVGSHDYLKETPLDRLMVTVWKYDIQGFRYMCSYLVSRGWTWSYVHLNRVQSLAFSSKFLQSPNTVYQGFEGNPLICAVLARSKPDLDAQLQNIYPMGEFQLENGLAASCDWPEGVRLILPHTRKFASCLMYEKALLGAYEVENWQTVDLLIGAGAKITGHMLEEISWMGEEVMNHVIQALKRQAYMGDEAWPRDEPESDGLLELTWLFCHVKNHKFAEALYNAGFRILDTPSYLKSTWESYFYDGTPLWTLAIYSFYNGFSAARDGTVHDIRLLQWFIDKGAQKQWIHPDSRTTPAHILATIPFRLSLTDLLQPYLRVRDDIVFDFTKEFFTSHCWWDLHVQLMISAGLDHCCCACSREGCFPITCAFKETLSPITLDSWWFPSVVREKLEDERDVTFDRVISWMDSLLSTSLVMANAVIRVLTFEKLGIRHTCEEMVFLRNPWPEGTCSLDAEKERAEKERNELHEEDADLIAKLDELTTEFEATYASSENPSFHDFYKGYWRSRMDEVLAEMNQVTKEYVDTVEKLGVVLEPFGPEPPPNLNRITEFTDSKDGF